MSAPKLETVYPSMTPLEGAYGARGDYASVTNKIPIKGNMRRRSTRDEKPKNPVTKQIEENEQRVLSMLALVNQSRSMIFPNNLLADQNF